jgi:hypothetical protein
MNTQKNLKDIFLTMRCVYCGADIDEDASAMPASRQNGSRNLIHTFNTQMAIIFELLSKVEHIRLADHLLRPDPIDLGYILDRQRSALVSGAASGLANTGGQNGAASGRLGEHSKSMSNLMGGGGRSNMIKYEKWSGDKTRNLDLLSQTKVSINFDSTGDSGGQARKPHKELPSILLLNRTQDEDHAASGSRDRDSILLSQVRLAADETAASMNAAAAAASATSPSKPASSLGEQSGSHNQSTSKLASHNSMSMSSMASHGTGVVAPSGASLASSVADLEQSIMQMLLKHEKKSTAVSLSSTGAGSDSQTTSSSVPSPVSPRLNNTNNGYNKLSLVNGNSSITIKKRAIENDYNSKNGYLNSNSNNGFNKKRKLNNGGKCPFFFVYFE